MRTFAATCWTVFLVLVVGIAAWLLGLGEVVRASIAAGHLLDWVMGGLCLLWLIVILKAPWDLFFQAQAVVFELQRAQERKVAVLPGRAEYVRRLRGRLAALAVGAHLLSAALVAGVALFTGGKVGYYFAVFYLVATFFRPALAGYVYLSRKLRAIGTEAHYPREDVVELRDRLKWQEEHARGLTLQLEQLQEALAHEAKAREREARELRQDVHAVGRQLESTVSRLTDNQEVITGIQAFVRLIAQAGRREVSGEA